MDVTLAGFNVDTSVVAEARERGIDPEVLTPEPLSAAYARISRYRKPVGELRRVARTEVAKARRSNHRIIWEMGHHSVAEHAVFNFDLVGVSRLAIEAVEQFRLCSFTEKSQRYITLDGDFVLPAEVEDAGLAAPFTELVEVQNALYRTINERLLERQVAAHPEDAGTRGGMRLLEGAAKEDARYVTALATEGQLGMTVNARNLELMVRRFAAHPLDEVRTLGQALFREVEKVAPSLVLFTEACDRDRLTYADLARQVPETMPVGEPAPSLDGTPEGVLENGQVRRVSATTDADVRLVAALLHTVSGKPYDACLGHAAGLDEAGLREVVTTTLRHMELYDSMLREFEHVGCSFELHLSAACFGQLKRHRMMTLTAQPYDPGLGLTIPPAVSDSGLAAEVQQVARRSEELAARIAETAPAAAPYALVNGHRRRALVSLNARELYHISRLREDEHAQWDIRMLSGEMVRQAREVMPLTMLLTGGKDVYVERYREVFGVEPGITETQLPGAKVPCGAG